MPIPEDLDLDSWINDPPSESSDSDDVDMNDIFVKSEKNNDGYDKRTAYEPSAEELETRREARKLEQQNNPHYLKMSATPQKKITIYDVDNDDDYENIPIAELNIPVSLKVSDSIYSNKYIDMNKSERRRRKKMVKKKKSKKSKYHNKFIKFHIKHWEITNVLLLI